MRNTLYVANGYTHWIWTDMPGYVTSMRRSLRRASTATNAPHVGQPSLKHQLVTREIGNVVHLETAKLRD